MILGSPRMWCFMVILHNLYRTLYSWRLLESMTQSTTYQVLAGLMRILWRWQSENWGRDGTSLCTRTKSWSNYRIMDWYGSVRLVMYMYLSCVMQAVERLWDISPERRPTPVNIWFNYRANSVLGEILLGQWLGVSHKVGQAMSYWILPVSDTIISWTTVQRLTQTEKSTEEYNIRMEDYNTNIV